MPGGPPNRPSGLCKWLLKPHKVYIFKGGPSGADMQLDFPWIPCVVGGLW
jgi:hypothetical protein